jgi:hypothetical protein
MTNKLPGSLVIKVWVKNLTLGNYIHKDFITVEELNGSSQQCIQLWE